MWDNAYAVHAWYDDAPVLASIHKYCKQFDTLDSVFQFASTSKITFAGAGIACLTSSPDNLAALKQHLAFQTIGPNKVNQLRHVRLLPDKRRCHPAYESACSADPGHASRCVLETLERELAGTGMGSWLSPRGGYFISFDTLARAGPAGHSNWRLDIGVKLTPAGATFPYGKDPRDSNIRLAPTYPSLAGCKSRR